MAALLDAEIESDGRGNTESGLGNGQSQSPSLRARAFVETISDKGTDSYESHPLSISLNPMKGKEKHELLVSPLSENSMRLNYGSASMQERLRLNLTPPHASHTQSRAEGETTPVSTPEVQEAYDYIAYEDADSYQKQEFEKLLLKESGCSRSWLHKGLIVNLFFFALLVVGVVLGEVKYPQEGVRGRDMDLRNDTTMCPNNTPACFTVRLVRAVGIFGFLGGVTNWIAIEMLFRSVPFLIGTGVFAKKHREIRESLKRIVVDVLFDPVALRHYFTSRQRNLREIFQLENHFGGLLESDVTRKIVDKKVDAILARPEGLMLRMMGVDLNQLKVTLKAHVHSFVTDISPGILDEISSSGLTDGVGLQAEVEKILEERTEELTALKVKQLMSAMIRKHLNWLIVWGNVLGALAGLLAEVIGHTIHKVE